VSRLQSAYQLTTSDAVTNSWSILLSIPLLVVETKTEEYEKIAAYHLHLIPGGSGHGK